MDHDSKIGLMVVHIVRLVTIGQRIDLRIVEQAARSVAPRETLVALAQVLVLDELGAGQIVRLLMAEVRVDQAQTDGGHGDQEG